MLADRFWDGLDLLPDAFSQVSGEGLHARQHVAVGDPVRQRRQGLLRVRFRLGGDGGEDKAAGDREHA